MSEKPSATEIQQAMAATRSALVADVAAVRVRANRLVDWRHQFRQHPAMFCGAAAVLGYLLVPKRSTAQPTNVIVTTPEGEPIHIRQPAQQAGLGTSLASGLLRMAVTTLAKEAANQLARQAQQVFQQASAAAAARHEGQPDDAPDDGPTDSSNGAHEGEDGP